MDAGMFSHCLLILTVVFVTGFCQMQDACNINTFETQPNFDPKKFTGTWYSISTNKHHQPELPDTFKNRERKNVKAFYTLLPNNTMAIKAAGSLFGNMCYYAKGISFPPDLNDTTKLEVHMFTKNSVIRPLWLATTDYTGYAVMYSCMMELANGVCDSNSIFTYTMNRHSAGHTEAELSAIDATLRRYCIEPATLTPIVQAGGCNFDPNRFPTKTYGFDRK